MPFDKEAVKAVNSKKQCDIDCAAGLYPITRQMNRQAYHRRQGPKPSAVLFARFMNGFFHPVCTFFYFHRIVFLFLEKIVFDCFCLQQSILLSHVKGENRLS